MAKSKKKSKIVWIVGIIIVLYLFSGGDKKEGSGQWHMSYSDAVGYCEMMDLTHCYIYVKEDLDPDRYCTVWPEQSPADCGSSGWDYVEDAGTGGSGCDEWNYYCRSSTDYTGIGEIACGETTTTYAYCDTGYTCEEVDFVQYSTRQSPEEITSAMCREALTEEFYCVDHDGGVSPDQYWQIGYTKVYSSDNDFMVFTAIDGCGGNDLREYVCVESGGQYGQGLVNQVDIDCTSYNKICHQGACVDEELTCPSHPHENDECHPEGLEGCTDDYTQKWVCGYPAVTYGDDCLVKIYEICTEGVCVYTGIGQAECVQDSCHDTDLGKTYNQIGYVDSILHGVEQDRLNDECEDSSILLEAYCDDDGVANVDEHDCSPGRCVNGMCEAEQVCTSPSGAEGDFYCEETDEGGYVYECMHLGEWTFPDPVLICNSLTEDNCKYDDEVKSVATENDMCNSCEDNCGEWSDWSECEENEQTRTRTCPDDSICQALERKSCGTITDEYCEDTEDCTEKGECVANEKNTACVSKCDWIEKWDKEEQECVFNFMFIIYFFAALFMLRMMGRMK